MDFSVSPVYFRYDIPYTKTWRLHIVRKGRSSNGESSSSRKWGKRQLQGLNRGVAYGHCHYIGVFLYLNLYCKKRGGGRRRQVSCAHIPDPPQLTGGGVQKNMIVHIAFSFTLRFNLVKNIVRINHVGEISIIPCHHI